MYRFLNQSNLLLFALVPILVILMGFFHWGAELNYVEVQPLSKLFANFEKGSFAHLREILGGLALIATAYLIASLNATHKIIDVQGTMISTIFLFLTSSINLPLSHPVYWANLLIFFSIYLLINSDQGEKAINAIFISSSLITISSFFVHTSLFFIPVVWAGQIIFKQFSFRLLFVSILGYLLPLIYLAAVRYLFYEQQFSAFINEMLSYHLQEVKKGTQELPQYIMLAYVMFLSAIAIMGFFGNYFKLVIYRRKSFRILLIIGLISPLFAISFKSASIEMLIFSCMPASFFIVRLLSTIRKEWIKSILIWLMIILTALIPLYHPLMRLIIGS